MDEERARATTPPRLALIITATLLGGLLAGVGIVGAKSMEPALTTAAQGALDDAGISGVEVRFEGREAYLTPAGATGQQLADAERVVEAVDGVRWATVVRSSPSAPPPQLLVLAAPGGDVVVTGVLGTAGEASAVDEAARSAFGPSSRVSLTVQDGVAVPSWTGSESALFGALAQVAHVDFTLAADGAHIAGEAADPDAVRAALEAALDPIPLVSVLVRAGPTPQEAAVINGTVIRFAADSVTLDAVARAQVAALADALRRFPAIGVTLTGHVAIPVGTEAQAIAFSRERAQSVADALIADGIASERIQATGAGSSQPIAGNGTPAGAAANRRVTVLLMEDG